MEPMIELSNVSKEYDGLAALKPTNLKIEKGEFVFLVGASGSGKSTFLKMINRQEKASSGTIKIAGNDISKLKKWKVAYLRRNIGCVFQDFKLLETKTVGENVAFALEVVNKPDAATKKQVPAILELVGLSDKADAYPHELSGGQQQRVSVARAFVNRPLILLADEPTGNLDSGTSGSIMRLLERINKTGTTVIMATHDMSIVSSMNKRVVALEQGKVVADQTGGLPDILTKETPAV